MNFINKARRFAQGLGRCDGVRYSFKINPESSQKFDELCKYYNLNKTKLFEKMIEDSISPIHYKGGNMINSRYSPNVTNGVLKRH